MTEAVVWIQTGAIVVTALAAVGVFSYARRAVAMINEHDRVLFGEDNNDAWDGIVSVVRGNRDRIKRNREQIVELRHVCDLTDESVWRGSGPNGEPGPAE